VAKYFVAGTNWLHFGLSDNVQPSSSLLVDTIPYHGSFSGHRLGSNSDMIDVKSLRGDLR